MVRLDLVYRASRLRLSRLVRELDAGQLDTEVPACPRWHVRDVAAHLAGVAHDFATDRLDGSPDPLWTRRHVRERHRLPMAAVLAEWERWAPRVERLLVGPDARGSLAHDMTQHEADVRAALGLPRLPGEVWHTMLDELCRTAEPWHDGACTLVVNAHGRTWWLGGGAPSAEVDVDGYELWRAWFGRRSPAQMRAWQWQGEPGPFITQLPVFGPRDTDLAEP
ncbi:maleylpyruvate isomerase family mycothiol-dependent enzyme [Streptomyces gilvosporeus]|nr:maleylpyruvate isomerase family mycothiol-dependent enzyme [Streptomyces gilvosporeus]